MMSETSEFVNNNIVFLRPKNLEKCDFKDTLSSLGACLQLERRSGFDPQNGESTFVWRARMFRDCRINFQFLCNANDNNARLAFAEKIVAYVTSLENVKQLEPAVNRKPVVPEFYSNYDPLTTLPYFDDTISETKLVPFKAIAETLGYDKHPLVKLCLKTGGLFYALRFEQYMPEIVMENINGDTMHFWCLIKDIDEEFYEKNETLFEWFFNMEWYYNQMYNPKSKFLVNDWLKFEIDLATSRDFACPTDDEDCCKPCSDPEDCCEPCSDNENCCKPCSTHCNDEDSGGGEECSQYEQDEPCCPYEDDYLQDAQYCHRKKQCKRIVEEQDDKNECKICFEKEMNCVLLPCKHLAVCNDCATDLINCPICRGKIDTKTVFIRA